MEHRKFMEYKMTMDLKELPQYEFTLVNNIQTLSEIITYGNMYEKLSPAIFYTGVDIPQ
jgi:hypothetical protein